MYGRKIRKGEYEFLGINEYGSTGTLYHVAYGVIRIKDISAAERQLLCETYSLSKCPMPATSKCPQNSRANWPQPPSAISAQTTTRTKSTSPVNNPHQI